MSALSRSDALIDRALTASASSFKLFFGVPVVATLRTELGWGPFSSECPDEAILQMEPDLGRSSSECLDETTLRMERDLDPFLPFPKPFFQASSLFCSAAVTDQLLLEVSRSRPFSLLVG